MTDSDPLAVVLAAAVAARPALDRAAFVAHLAARAPIAGDVAAADLALAFQAAHGDPRAATEVHALVERTRPVLAAAGYSATLIDDVVQETLILLVVGNEGGGRPALLTYQGRAALATWITTIVLRTAARLGKIGAASVGDTVLAGLAAAHDPAAAVIKAELRPAVHDAFVAAVRRLSYFDRELLADVILHSRSIDELGRKHEVHRATAARWVARSRTRLDDWIRHELGASLALDDSEVASVLGAVATGLELTPVHLIDGVPGLRR